MNKPDFIFITGCNAAGKSSLIRTHLSEYSDYQIIMTDVYKSRSREVFVQAIKNQKNIILETPFNNEKFKEFADLAASAGYDSSLTVLFLESPTQSFERVVARSMLEKGLYIPEEEVKYNFEQNFKNVASYYFYFDNTYFIYTGVDDMNQHIMTFSKNKLTEYKANDLDYVQRFAGYAYSIDRLDKKALDIISSNAPFIAENMKQGIHHKFRLRP